ncbi:MAG: trypsin-like peptidase domain-containing protein [Clostridia bacterium]|nr:trypsin-like peptidase domain-containing protein [Clostridia bacterium]
MIKGAKKQVNIFFVVVLCLVVGMFGGVGGSFLYNLIASDKDVEVFNSTSVSTSQERADVLSTDEVVEKVSDSVVDVSTQVITQMDSKNYTLTSAGSGVVYSSDGYIVTNNHVIKGANKIIVTLKNGTKYAANIVGADAENDLAVLKVDAHNLHPVEIEDYSKVKLGEETIVIGNPLGELSGTITDGVVSALSRTVMVDGKKMNLMQTCAEINEGNSGGGVFDREGKLIGIVVAKTSGAEVEGLGFAIPSDTVKRVVEGLIKSH